MGCFKVEFDIKDYADILPDPVEYLKHDFIINNDEWVKGNFDNCVWRRHEPSIFEINSIEYREREAARILRTGAWIAIKDELIWLPPNYYFFLQYWNVGGLPPDFRIKRLKHVYFKHRVRFNPKIIGSYTIKNRQDGETTSAMSDCMWDCAEGNMTYGAVGVQSKTRQTVVESCWRAFTMGWNAMDSWLKKDLFSDMASGDQIVEKMKFVTQKTETNKGRDILVTYGASKHNAFDSMNNMRRCVLDEVNKYTECSFYATFLNYEKFIAPGTFRKGLFDIFSSPGDMPGKHNEEAYSFWKGSNPDEMIDGTTATRVLRYYSNPLEGIEGEYDKWGDADADAIYKTIMKKRKSIDKEFLLGEIRANPLNEDEMFDSAEGGEFWSNHKGINQRKIYLIGSRFKSEETKEPKCVYGNLEWKDGIKDSIVNFRQADIDKFDVHKARFCFSYLPKEDTEPMRNIFTRPDYTDNCIGIDPVDKRYPGKRASDFAMTNYKFRDLENTGIVKCPTMLYLVRPLPIEISYEDAIKACVFLKAPAQIESLNSKCIDWFEDRGYIDWLLSKMGQPRNSLQKGDAPTSKSAFIDEIVGLIDAATNVPLNPGDPYPLELYFIHELLEDISRFNIKDTHTFDATMSFGQALLGSAKLLFQKVRAKSSFNDKIVETMSSW